MVAIIGIILAIAIPYYVGYKRTACDRAASADISKLGASIERLGNEVVDLNGRFDQDLALTVMPHVARFVGTYYGWGGTTTKCGVQMMWELPAGETQYMVRACSVLGSRPDNANTDFRYIYSIPFGGGISPAATVAQCTDNTLNDKPPIEPFPTTEWHALPPNNPGIGPNTCNDQSMITGVAAGVLQFSAAAFVDGGKQQ